MDEIIQMFIAFNVNGFNHLLYTISTNWFFVIMILCAGISMIMYTKMEVEMTVEDKQNIM